MSHKFQNVWLCCHGRARHKGKVEGGGGTPKGKARHTINLQEASYDVLMIQKESLQSSFVTDPDDGSFTQIPWYLMNNVDLNSSQRTLTQSQISNQTFKSLVQRFESLKMSQSSQVQPDDLYERDQVKFPSKN